MIRADLFRQHPDVAKTDAEFIVAGAILGVMGAHLLAAERFELFKSFLERHGLDLAGESFAESDFDEFSFASRDRLLDVGVSDETIRLVEAKGPGVVLQHPECDLRDSGPL